MQPPDRTHRQFVPNLLGAPLAMTASVRSDGSPQGPLVGIAIVALALHVGVGRDTHGISQNHKFSITVPPSFSDWLQIPRLPLAVRAVLVPQSEQASHAAALLRILASVMPTPDQSQGFSQTGRYVVRGQA